MIKRIFLFAFLISIYHFFIVSCHSKKKTVSETTGTSEMKRDFEKEGYIKAMVMYSNLDGCSYLIVLASEKRLEPSADLAPEFQKDKLAVWIKYVEQTGRKSICMAGMIVVISDMQIRK